MKLNLFVFFEYSNGGLWPAFTNSIFPVFKSNIPNQLVINIPVSFPSHNILFTLVNVLLTSISIFDTFFNEAVEGGTLPEREKVVAILTSATLLNDQGALKNAVLMAKQLGFNSEEIGQITAIAVNA